MLDMKELRELQQKGQISNQTFLEDAYKLEQEKIFAKCWLFVGHESMIPNKGDYISSFMGEDPVIVNRDSKGNIKVLLNRCRHRGNKVCLFDKGNAATFTCNYHGWSYNNEGRLTGVPFMKEAYFNELDKECWGLTEAPKVSSYGGLIFANWDADAMSLDEYLGDIRWYLENFLILEDLGGLEVVPGKQRYTMPANWKLLAENFMGDDYHFPATHASLLKALSNVHQNRQSSMASSLGPTSKSAQQGKNYAVLAGYKTGVPHGLLELKIGERYYAEDLAAAKQLGKESEEWVAERYRRLQERLKDATFKPYSFHVGTIFPNFSLIGIGTALYGRGFVMWHPKGPFETEVWEWCAVEKNAPKALKARQNFVLMQRQSAAGMVAPDDHENFERLSDNMKTPMSKKYPFNYEMGIRHAEEIQDYYGEPVQGLPGRVIANMSEMNQREFYRYWNELMEKGDR